METEKTPRKRASKFIKDLVPDWHPKRQGVLRATRITIVVVALLGLLTLIGLPFGISLWAWVKLLIVPAAIAGGGLWFNAQQSAREQQIANDRAQDEALQAFLDQMGTLLLKEKDLKNDRVSSLMRARTITVLGGLDANRKTQVMRFLIEARLVQRVDENFPVIGLERADLSATDLSATDLNGAYLDHADLRDANLINADLTFAALQEADLRNADFYIAYLTNANVNHADLRDANLSAATLSHTDLNHADLRDANLDNADLSFADLSAADLRNVHGALRVFGTDQRVLSANLRDPSAKDNKPRRLITNEELEKHSPTLTGTTMPNGQKYEDWLKDR